MLRTYSNTCGIMSFFMVLFQAMFKLLSKYTFHAFTLKTKCRLYMSSFFSLLTSSAAESKHREKLNFRAKKSVCVSEKRTCAC